MDENENRFASFGSRPDPRFWSPPSGVCLSSFVIIRKGKGFLMGRIAKPELWRKKWNLPQTSIPWDSKWLIPASHLKYGEHPKDGAKRILKEMLGVSSYGLKFMECQSHLSEDGHWDLCFLYEAQLKEKIETEPWFLELRYRDPVKMSPKDFGRGHEDALRIMLENERRRKKGKA